MRERPKFILPLLLSTLITGGLFAQGNAPKVTGFSPQRYSTQNKVNPFITATFDTQMNANTINASNVLVYGEFSGFHSGNVLFLANTRTMTYSPSTPFFFGEMVTVILTSNISSTNGTPLANTFQWSFFIEVSRSSGVFASDGKYSSQNGPQGLALADFNKDNNIDVAVSHSSVNQVEIFLNNGSGKLQSFSTINVESQPRSIVAGHFNSDSNIDVAVANEASGTISILLNDGQGNFTAQSALPVTGSVLAFIITGDFNGDGKFDFATINRGSNNITVVLNSDTTFTETGPFSVGASPRTGFTADFNNDGILDIATANKDDSNFSLLVGVGDGTFLPQQSFASGAGPHYISGGDFNGDNISDIVITNRDEDTVWSFLNNGTGQFTFSRSSAVGREPRSLFVRDFDGDLDFDVMAGNFESDEITYIRNAGGGSLVVDSTYASGNAPRIVAGADMDSDGDVDLVVSNWGENSIEVYKNISTGTANIPPDAPSLISPADAAFFNNSSPRPILQWLVPNDINNDLLHFRIELSNDPGFNQTSIIESTSDVTGFSPTPPVPSGQDTASYSFAADLVDGQIWWRVTAWDSSAFGTPSGSRSFTVDKSLPTGSVASSPSISEDENFIVSWSRGTDTGSGLSGLYDVMVQVDNGPWTIWQSSSSDTFATYNGQHTHTYGFEAAARDRAGNIEAFLQIAETTTEVDTNANDFTAPGPPLSLTAGGSNPSPWQNSSSFQIEWVPPSDLSGIAKALYKVGNAPTANFDTTASIINNSPFTFQISQQDGQNFHLWFQDNRGNVDYRNRGTLLLRYDSTTPTINALTIPNPDFPPFWLNQAQTTLSGVNVRYNEKHPLELMLESTDLNISTSLAQIPGGSNISFNIGLNTQNKPDGRFELKVTLTDSAGNSTSSTTTLGLDSTPPTGTETSSPDTSTSGTFVVTWTGSGSDNNGSGLSGNYDLRFQVDNGSWQTLATNLNATSYTFQGEQGRTYGFEVAAYDNVGNMEAFSDQAESMTVVDTGFVDIDAPTISHQPQTTVDEGEDLTIQADVVDNSGVTQVVLYYKQGGTETFQAMRMTLSSGSTYSATIPSTEVSIFGINYYIEAWDGINFSYVPQTNWDTMPLNISVRIVGTNNSGLIKTIPQPGGEESTFYRMISVPLNLTNPNPLAVLEDDLGSYDANSWRLFQYRASSGSYVEYPNVNPFTPGVVGWLIVRDPDKQIDSGVGATLTENSAFEITLEQGWNDFGIPFTYAIDWNDIQVISSGAGNVMGPYTYQGQWLLPNQVTTLSPWEGYSIYTQTSGIRLSIPPIQSTNTQPALALSKKATHLEWSLGITATAGQIQETSAYLGVAANALTEWDPSDYLKPPYIADFVSVNFPHNDWQGFRGNFTTDVRPPFSEAQVWHFEIETTVKNSMVSLEFTNLASLPEEFDVILRDNSNLQEINIRESGRYDFLPQQRILKRKFDLIIGAAEYLDNPDQIKELQPETFALSQNFPNPFNAGTSFNYQIAERSHVRIDVLNILGQRVRKLLSEEKAPGNYRMKWDGRGDNGLELGSGIYMIKLEAGSFQQTRKVILLR